MFYIHSRLLERAAKLSPELGGGSLTALPIAETQAGNLSGYVPTNLISITDGQIYFEPKLFYEGQKPAINVGLSVSRVGGKTQAPILKQLARNLKLEYAQFLELEVFARFGSMVDERTKARIEHGRRIRQILAQPQYRPLRLIDLAALLLSVKEGKLDKCPPDSVERFKSGLGDWLDQHVPRIEKVLAEKGELKEDEIQALLGTIDDFIASIAPPVVDAQDNTDQVTKAG